MKKIILLVILLLASSSTYAVPTCKGLIGTWSVIYNNDPDKSATFVIKSIGPHGDVYGNLLYLYEMEGYCKNGIVSFSQANGTKEFFSYYFANEKNSFSRIMFLPSPGYSGYSGYSIAWFDAKIKKVSSSTDLSALNDSGENIIIYDRMVMWFTEEQQQRPYSINNP